MGAFVVKVYVVQEATREGVLGDVIAVKLTYGAAHAIAKKYAPCRVHMVLADKNELLSVLEPTAHQPECN